MKISHTLIVVAFLTSISCVNFAKKDKGLATADSLAQALIITDTHIDLPERLKELRFQLKDENMAVVLEDKLGEF